MTDKILLGRGNQMLEMPRQQWEAHLAHAPQHTQTRFGFMTSDHHAVRYFVVRELPRRGNPLARYSQRRTFPVATGPGFGKGIASHDSKADFSAVVASSRADS